MAECHLEPGLFTLGDINYLDDGLPLPVHPQSEVIISGGVELYPAEIEGQCRRVWTKARLRSNSALG